MQNDAVTCRHGRRRGTYRVTFLRGDGRGPPQEIHCDVPNGMWPPKKPGGPPRMRPKPFPKKP